jgi:light-regulated signal transduction histidine kinase (bacteriophytochrome)
LESSLYAVRDDVQRSGAHVEIEPGLPTVQGNRSVLIQVFSNLLSNAVKFGGREPHVRVWAEAREARIAHVWVEDQGIGIAPEHQDRIFGVFERLHGAETYPGTGIGLAIVSSHPGVAVFRCVWNEPIRTSTLSSAIQASASSRNSCLTCSSDFARQTVPRPVSLEAWGWDLRSSVTLSNCMAGRLKRPATATARGRRFVSICR